MTHAQPTHYPAAQPSPQTAPLPVVTDKEWHDACEEIDAAIARRHREITTQPRQIVDH